MAATLSTMLDLGTRAPDFSLPNVMGGTVSLDNFRGSKGLLVMFICNHCPFVKHLNNALVEFANDYKGKGIECVAISSNDIANYPQDSPDYMRKVAIEYAYPFPYLFDEDQQIAKAYKAACTPDFYLFDESLKLYYRGQFDQSRPGNNMPISGRDLRMATDTMLEGEEKFEPQLPSMGCNIKWKPGNEPEYFKK